MSQLLKDLRAVKRLLRKEENWTQGTFSRKPFRRKPCAKTCDPTDPKADCWCLWGAAIRVTADKNSSYSSIREGDIMSALEKAIGISNIPNFNDYTYRKHSDIVAAINQAIKTEEAKSK